MKIPRLLTAHARWNLFSAPELSDEVPAWLGHKVVCTPIQPFSRPPQKGLTLEEEQSFLKAAASSSTSPSSSGPRHEPPTKHRRHALHGHSGCGHPKDPPLHKPELTMTAETPRSMFHPASLTPAAMAAAAAASSAVRAAAISQNVSPQPTSSAPPLYPAHLVPRPMFQGLPLSSVPSTASPSGVNSLNLLGEALALRGGLALNGLSGPSSSTISTRSDQTASKYSLATSPSVSFTPSSASSSASSSSPTSSALHSFSLNSQASSMTAPLVAPPSVPHPALLLPGRAYPGHPTLDENQLRYLSLAQIQAANQAHLAGEVAKLKQQSPPFLTRNYLELAMLVCNTFRGKLFPCPHCRYVTDRRNNLKRHIATMHQTCDKQLECCGVRFSTKASLREHITIFHHNGYSCPFCGRRFCRKALLKRHLSVHSGQKDYTCPSCDYATSHKSNLERHKRIHARLHLMGGDASGLGHDIDEEELRRMEEEEEEEDRRRHRQTASMMMMLDEDDDETQDIDLDGERGERTQHQHFQNGGKTSKPKTSDDQKHKTTPSWSLPNLMRPETFSFLNHPPLFMSNSLQETSAKVNIPFPMVDDKNHHAHQPLSQLGNSTTTETPPERNAEASNSEIFKDEDEELDVEIDVNGDVTDDENVNEKSFRQEVKDSKLVKKTIPDASKDRNNVNNNNNNNNETDIRTKPPLYRPFSAVFSPAGHARENQPINLIVGSKQDAKAADITMATRLAHGFEAGPSLQHPRF
ncbi:zinc finger protein 484-like [Elysia marginata]|uniref:Zinc finger protein 484-like n=1 Tax=Elysia marginata TaxID=1093978 RepID=A0AAV4GQI2_9GAST|nr:zinc finger protein 484-like [Elysia marginata]